MINVGDKNFLGTGDAISLTYQRSGSESDAQGFVFSYRHPWIDKKETVGTLKIYNRTYEYSDYDTDGNKKESYMRKYSGGELTLGRPVSEYSTNAKGVAQGVAYLGTDNAGTKLWWDKKD